MIRNLTEHEKAHGAQPIYRIMMMSKSGADPIVYETGKNSGFPDTGYKVEMGFYYDKDLAIEAMHRNGCDIRECCYNYGYVIMQLPGLYQSAGSDERQYFKWDEDRQGFFEAEEPELMRFMAL